MVSSKPTILIIAGAYHSWSALQPFPKSLEEAGYAVAGETLPSVGSTRPLEDDVDMIRNQLERLVTAEGKDVIAVFHSYSGVPGSVAVGGWSKAERSARGEQGGIIGLVWLASFPARPDTSLANLLEGQIHNWTSADPKNGIVSVADDPAKIFYGDVDAAKASALAKDVRHQSLMAVTTEVSGVGYTDEGFDGRRAFILTTKDRAVEPQVQEKLIRDSGVEWMVKKMDSDHSPFVSHTGELLKVLEELVEDFNKKPSESGPHMITGM